LRMRVDIRFNSFFTVVSRVLKRQCKSGDSCTTQTDQRVMAHYKDGGGRDSRKRSRDDYDDAPRHKRGRYFDQGSSESESTEQKLESLITRVGEKGNKTLQSNLQALADVLHTEIGSSSSVKDKVLRTICFCVTSLTEKITVYSTLVAILNARQYNFGEELLEVLMEDLRNALALQDMEKARILVRFLADLVNAKVVASSSIMTLFDTFITVTYEPDIPHTRSDWYVYMILSALPWVGSEVNQRKKPELERLFTILETYMSKRSTAYLPAVQVWTTDQPHPQKDYLEMLWIQTKNMKDNEWKEHILMRPYTHFDSEIGGAYSHTLPTLNVPNHAEESVYPLPHSVFRVYETSDLQYAPAGYILPPFDSMDRYLAEETVRCIVQSHHTNRKECVSALLVFAKGVDRIRLPAEYVITEVLFGLLFKLPSPPQVPVCYGSLLIELCKADPATFPQILTQTTDLLYNRLDKMNTVCVGRFSQWFAYHLSNFKYQWDWSSWSNCLSGPPDGPGIQFITRVFEKCARLGCYDVFSELIQPPFSTLLPPEPLPVFKYTLEEDEFVTPLPECTVATQLLEAIKEKKSFEHLTSILDTLSSVLPELENDRDKLCDAKVSLLTHCVLHVSCKTISHSFMALYKFRPLFLELAKTDETKLAVLKALAEFYTNNPQVHAIILDKLIRSQIVDAMVVVNWLFLPTTVQDFHKQYVWDILESTVQKN
jgi:nuclear cap-binding protein subunit 1